MHLLTAFVLLGALASYVVGQCPTNSIIPDFYGSSEVVYVGDRLFDAIVGDAQCKPSQLITGPVYLYRPGDSTFVPLKVGYWNGLNASVVANTIFAPDVSPKGYGYRVVIVPDRKSPDRAPLHSATFALVTQAWFDVTYSQVTLWAPSSAYDDTTWSSTGEQLISWDVSEVSNTRFDSFAILLYKATDVTWGPLVLAHKVTGASCPNNTCAAVDYYFKYKGTLPLGPNYQVVLQPTAEDKSEVISMTALIEIVDSPVTTNTFPYTWTPIKTISSQKTGK